MKDGVGQLDSVSKKAGVLARFTAFLSPFYYLSFCLTQES